jgi:hypothetical protein
MVFKSLELMFIITVVCEHIQTIFFRHATQDTKLHSCAFITYTYYDIVVGGYQCYSSHCA